MAKIEVATIGFTKSNAEDFFERLLAAGVTSVLDVRLHNTSQLAGFAKADDLAYFLQKIGGISYVHEPLLAPTEPIFTAYKKEKGNWETFRGGFLGLMEERRIETVLDRDMLEGACLLCSEAEPHHCHRSLVIDYLNDRWGGTLIARHL